MKKLFMLWALLSCLLAASTCFAGLGDYPNVAVLNFSNRANASAELTFEDTNAVTDYVIEGLLDSSRFNVIERDQLAAVLNEHYLNLTGLIDPQTAVQIGKLAGVQYIVYGNVVGLSAKETGLSYNNSSYGGVGNTQYTVTANVTLRMIDTQTGRIVLAAHGQGSSSSSKTELSFDNRRVERDTRVYHNHHGDTYLRTRERIAGSNQTISIGAASVSQVQVHNALEKAANDVVNGKMGVLSKLSGKGKKR